MSDAEKQAQLDLKRAQSALKDAEELNVTLNEEITALEAEKTKLMVVNRTLLDKVEAAEAALKQEHSAQDDDELATLKSQLQAARTALRSCKSGGEAAESAAAEADSNTVLQGQVEQLGEALQLALDDLANCGEAERHELKAVLTENDRLRAHMAHSVAVAENAREELEAYVSAHVEG